MITKIKIVLLIVFASAYSICSSQTIYTKRDSVIYTKYITEFSKYKDKSINELLVLTGTHFLGKPYVAATLESLDEEQLVINLREFDCTTFVESNIALIKELKKGKNGSFMGFMEGIKNMRYREGRVNGYSSRLHYTSDWVYENTDLFENVTIKLGGSIVTKPLSFMSTNIELYPALKASKSNQEKIKTIEQSVNKRNSYALLPISKLKSAEKDIKTGDIIIFATRVHGLDYSHIGIAFWEGKTLKLLHASSARKKVVIDLKSLVQYCTTSKSCTGITILRLKDN